MMTSSHFHIDRRLMLVGAASLVPAIALAPAAQAMPPSFVRSETGSLRTVLVHPTTVADHAHCTLTCGANPFWQDALDEMVAQQAALTAQLEASGATVLRLDAMLAAAIESAKQQRVWNRWAPILRPDIVDSESLDAAALLGRGDRARPGAMDGLTCLRDFAVMLPAGLLLCKVTDPARARQSDLFRFILAFAPALRSYPVVFDARREGLRAEGADVQLLDAETLLIGVGNHSDPRLAPLLARRVGMDVIAVDIRDGSQARWRLNQDPMRDVHLHLNTALAQIAPECMLALPQLVDAEGFGSIRFHYAHSGLSDPSVEGMRLVDYLRARGTRIHVTDGEKQATNMLATDPGVMLAFAGADVTHNRLRGEGIRLSTVAGPEVGAGYAGPHCLTLPLERA